GRSAEASPAARLHVERRERRLGAADRRGPSGEQARTDDARRSTDRAAKGRLSARDRSRAAALQRQPFPQPLAPAAVRALRVADFGRGTDRARPQERLLPDERPPVAAADARPA